MTRVIFIRKKRSAQAAISLADSAVNASDLTTYTFSSLSFGSAQSDRYLIACITARAGALRTISSVTIGGVSASQVEIGNNDTGGNRSVAAIYIAAVPTGTSGDVEVTFSGSMTRAGVALYRMVGGSPTATDTGNSTSSNPSTSLDIAANGSAVAVSFTAATGTATWSGLTEDVDALIESGGGSHSASSGNFSAAQTGLSVQCTWTTNTVPAFAAASFPPA